MKEDMSLSNLGTVALHAAKVPTNMFSSTLICILTLDYYVCGIKLETKVMCLHKIRVEKISLFHIKKSAVNDIWLLPVVFQV